MATVFAEPPVPPSSPYGDPQGSSSYTDSLGFPPERRPLSICLDVPPSSSPFPSPSSSFLPPPMPGNHEFAMRAPPAGRRKGSLVPINGKEDGTQTPVAVELVQRLEAPLEEKESLIKTDEGGTTPTPTPEAVASSPAPVSTPAALSATSTPIPDPTTPTPSLAALPSATSSTISIPSPLPSPSSSSATATTFSSTSTSTSSTPTPNRPAPPSPAASRRVSSMSTFSDRSTHSRRVSRANSTRKSNNNTFHHTPAPPTPAPDPKPLIKIKDFAFPSSDDRFVGAGALVPRANHLALLHRRLAGVLSDSDEEDGEDDGEGDGEGEGAWDMLRSGWRSFGFGLGFSGAGGTGAGGAGPSQAEIDLNFGAYSEEEPEPEPEEDEGEPPLYPGLYRALYAFEPEGTAEMRLVEDQVVRVVGRGGGVGWAVVVESGEGEEEKHALVPEGYLEVVRLDWEDEEGEEGV